MPQETNLNILPYFDDFDPEKDYYKVLFKPGYPVQARELTTLQSILQNQIETFGNHIFKEGTVVIPGNVVFRNDVNAVILDDQFLGLNVDLYLNGIKSIKIKGRTSGITAIVNSSITSSVSRINKPTLYVSYLSSDSLTYENEKFLPGEVLEVSEENGATAYIYDIETSTFSLKTFQQGEPFASTVFENPNATASTVVVQSGVWYLRGTFVRVPEQLIYLDQYANDGSYNIGFRIKESIVNSYEDSSLNDNAQGFSNYASPGSDRFKIEAKLEVLSPDSIDDDNFVLIKQIRNGVDVSFRSSTEYSNLSQEFAKRTYDESGDYFVRSPNISAKESLNDFKGNNGIFNENELTYNNNVPNDDLGTYIITPSSAYVSGYSVGNLGNVFVDFKKPRTIKTLKNQFINYQTGSTFTLNKVYGSPIIGLTTSYVLSLRDSRVGISSTVASGKEIGVARVYDFALESGSYTVSNTNINEWDITLYDIQSHTEITVNNPIPSLLTPTHIKGKSSGAIGYLRYDVTNSGILTAYNVKGQFSIGEKLIFDGIENNRISVAVTSFSIGDVKSVYGIVGSAYTFTADTKQSPLLNIGSVNITQSSGGISTVTSPNINFIGIVTVGNLVSYTNPGFSTVSFAKVQNVSQKSISIIGVTTVNGICDGGLPSSNINPNDFNILVTKQHVSSDNTLYTYLPKRTIASVDLTDADLIIRKQFDVTIASNSTGPIVSGANQFFLPFDEERYVLVRENGVTEELTPDKFSFTSGSTILTINGLTNGTSNAKLIATLRKINIKEKTKIINRVKSIIVNKSKYEGSGIGATTLNDGLTYGNYPYGTRVQDEEICLLEPDVTKLYGIFLSDDTLDPDIPSIVFSSLISPTNKTGDLLIGEEFIGKSSGAVGVYLEKINDLKIGFVSQNQNNFIIGEVVTFKESGITAIVSAVDFGDLNVTSLFSLDKSQNDTIYDYSKIVRNSNVTEPNRKLKILYEYVNYSTSDTGDITTVNSYNQFDYCDINETNNGIRNTDLIDIRQRVSTYSVSEGARSPFEFLARSFTINSASNVLASDEDFKIDYSFYLPRIDKLFLTKDGVFQLNYGQPEENPSPPSDISDALELATIILPAYLCDMNDITINLKEHKRYRMVDIRKLEQRIQNLEYYTSLSLLEIDTANLQITDYNGLNRFKSGFFVDDFSSTTSQKKVTQVKNSIDIKNSILRPTHYTTQVDLTLGSNAVIGIGTVTDPTIDNKFVTDLNGTNIRKTGQLITLDYEEVSIINQPFSTRVVNVSPYSIAFYAGTMELFPSSDVWVDQVRTEAKIINVEGNYTQTRNQLSASGFDAQTGFGPVTWGSWETVWTGESSSLSSIQTNDGYSIYDNVIKTSSKTGTSTRQGNRQIIKEQFDKSTFGDQVLNSTIIPYLRSRNIEFTAKRMKPYTRVYGFLDGVSLNQYITPKLIEITMVNGVFQVGETVVGYNATTEEPKFYARVANQNHKYGPYNNPTETYDVSVYDTNIILGNLYSSTSSILNIDTYSMANIVQGSYRGYIELGMKLKGQTSGAEAVVSNIRLVTDNVGTIIGSVFIPDPNKSGIKFESGAKTFRLTSNKTNSQIQGSFTTSVDESYFSDGKINTVQENIISVRNFRIETQNTSESQTASQTDYTVVSSNIIGYIPQASYGGGGGYEPPTPQPTPQPTPTAPTSVNYGTIFANFGGKSIGEYADRTLSTLAAAGGLPQSFVNSIKEDQSYGKSQRDAQIIEAALAAKGISVNIEVSPIRTDRTGDYKGPLQTSTEKTTQIAASQGVGVSQKPQSSSSSSSRSSSSSSSSSRGSSSSSRGSSRR